VPDRHLTLLHHLERGGLHLRRRTVDLVGQEKVAEDRAELRIERAFAGAVETSVSSEEAESLAG
jgi:hypothetical protein